MGKLKSKKGLSRIEFFCIIGIVLCLIFIVFTAVCWYHNSLAKGNDRMKANTAESVAAMNLAESGCIVTGCEGGFDERCEHENEYGETTGYYDIVQKKIYAEKPAGYNEYLKMEIEEREYEGERGTMVIQVTGSADEITLKWIEGDNK